MKNKEQKIRIGGQALIEGVMMRKKNTIAMAVRLPDGNIDREKFDINFLEKIKWYSKIPIFRGVVEMIVSFIIGYKCLLKSAQKAGLEEKEEKNNKKDNIIIGMFSFLGAILGVLATIVLFMYLPSFFVKQLSNIVPINNFFKVSLEGLIKIFVFVFYLFIISNLKDIKRTFQYHGAEHKTIACFEKGEELTVENVKKCTRFHPRCGTNFIFIVLFISIFIFSFLTWNNLLVRLILKFSTLPLVTGLSYEVIRLAGKENNIIGKIMVAPGLCLQRLTTKEPDEKQIEVAIASVEEVLKEKSENKTNDI